MPQIGPEVPPIRLDRMIAVFLSKPADIGVLRSLPIGQHDLKAARERVAKIAVADHRVELAEVLLIVDRGLRDRPHDQLYRGSAALSLMAPPCRCRG